MNIDIASSHLLDDESLTDSLNDEQAEKIISWALQVLESLASLNWMRFIDEGQVTILKSVVGKVNSFYEKVNVFSELEKEALLVEIYIRVSQLWPFKRYGTSCVMDGFLNDPEQSLIDNVIATFTFGGRDE